MIDCVNNCSSFDNFLYKRSNYRECCVANLDKLVKIADYPKSVLEKCPICGAVHEKRKEKWSM